jgi:nitroimidazol reductase NimA-like FMN-containing flavoprotein (pyridoxamine 5'-phosphate oxidase superfamily)
MQSESTPHRLVELAADECWELAASRPVGRLAWAGPSGPTVIPVNFVVDGRTVRVRTTAYSAAARECDDSPVAFEVDTFDIDEHTGWSVLLRGRAHLEYGEQAREHAPEPWVTGPRTLVLWVDVTEVSGRRLGSD